MKRAFSYPPKEMDGGLSFEVLLYLNSFYFGLFFFAETVMVLAKYFSKVLPTPNIDADAAVLCAILGAEIIKLSFFERVRETRPGLSTVLAINMTAVSIVGLLYVLLLQEPVLKMEYIVCGVMLALMVAIIMYGFLQYLPCCKKKQYV